MGGGDKIWINSGVYLLKCTTMALTMHHCNVQGRGGGLGEVIWEVSVSLQFFCKCKMLPKPFIWNQVNDPSLFVAVGCPIAERWTRPACPVVENTVWLHKGTLSLKKEENFKKNNFFFFKVKKIPAWATSRKNPEDILLNKPSHKNINDVGFLFYARSLF